MQAQLTGTRKLQMSYERLLTAFSAKCTALKDAQDVTPIASVLRSVSAAFKGEFFVQALSAAREQFGKDLAELGEKSGAEAADAGWAAEKRNFEAQLTETKAIVGELRGDIDEQQLAAEQLRALVAGADGATS